MCRYLLTFVLALLIGLATSQASAADARIIYVKADARGANNGTSWANAYTSLQTALAAATSDTEIWVAMGTYLPTTGASRRATFHLKNGVALYGGFRGHETARDQRNWIAYQTILNGDIGLRGIRDDNVYHVVMSSDNDATAVLDGFTITDGNATGADWYSRGGGMLNVNGGPTVRNCTFTGNQAIDGGGMLNYTSSPTVIQSVFRGNTATNGGGMYNAFGSHSTVINALFIGNTAHSWGGGMHNYTECNPTLVNVVFSGNQAQWGGAFTCYGLCGARIVNATFSWNRATSQGGALYNVYAASPTVHNSILWANFDPPGEGIYVDGSSVIQISHSLVDGGWPGAGNLDADPLFEDTDGADDVPGTADDDLRLQRDSPALDIGDNAAVPADTMDLDRDGDLTEPLPRDLDGVPRFACVRCSAPPAPGTLPRVDLGAYERQSFRLALYFPLALAR